MSKKRKGRRIIIGDIQGCADEFAELLDAVGYREKRDRLWLAGDIVNRGPKSLEALELAVDLGAKAVLGNHDVHLLMIAAGARPHGRKDTLEPLLESVRAAELLDWLRRRPLIKVWDDLILVHAALHPRWKDPEAVAKPLEKGIRKGTVDWRHPDLHFFTNARRCDRKGRLPPKGRRAAKRYRPWDDHYQGRRMVAFGHWAARGLVVRKKIRGLDSGCVWGGELTAWIVEEDTFVSVPSRCAYQEI